MLDIAFDSEAEEEMSAAAVYYEEQRSGLGDEFLDEIPRTLKRIVDWPEGYPVIYKNVRRITMKRFTSYGLHYTYDGERIRVVAVKHSSRHPDYWKERL